MHGTDAGVRCSEKTRGSNLQRLTTNVLMYIFSFAIGQTLLPDQTRQLRHRASNKKNTNNKLVI